MAITLAIKLRAVIVFVKSPLIRRHQIQIQLGTGTGSRQRYAAMPLRLQKGEILRRDITGNIMPVETGGFIAGNRWIDPAYIFYKGIDILVNEMVGPDLPADFVLVSASGDEFLMGGHINSINVWKPHRGRGRSKIYLMGAGFLRHLHNFTASGAAYDGIINQQYILAAEFHTHGIELL